MPDNDDEGIWFLTTPGPADGFTNLPDMVDKTLSLLFSNSSSNVWTDAFTEYNKNGPVPSEIINSTGNTYFESSDYIAIWTPVFTDTADKYNSWSC